MALTVIFKALDVDLSSESLLRKPLALPSIMALLLGRQAIIPMLIKKISLNLILQTLLRFNLPLLLLTILTPLVTEMRSLSI